MIGGGATESTEFTEVCGTRDCAENDTYMSHVPGVRKPQLCAHIHQKARRRTHIQQSHTHTHSLSHTDTHTHMCNHYPTRPAPSILIL